MKTAILFSLLSIGLFNNVIGQTISTGEEVYAAVYANDYSKVILETSRVIKEHEQLFKKKGENPPIDDFVSFMYFLRGEAFYNIDEYLEAYKNFKVILNGKNTAKDIGKLYVYLGSSAVIIDSCQEAIKYLDKAINLGFIENVYLWRSHAWFCLEDKVMAEGDLDKVRLVDSTTYYSEDIIGAHVTYLYQLAREKIDSVDSGNEYYINKFIEKAKEFLTRYPENSQNWARLGWVYHHQTRFRESYNCYLKAAQLGKSSDYQYSNPIFPVFGDKLLSN